MRPLVLSLCALLLPIGCSDTAQMNGAIQGPPPGVTAGVGAPAGGAIAPAPAQAGTGGDVGTAGATSEPVITIGDSWMDYILGGGGIQAGLDRAGTNYRHYALSGTQLLNGQIPSQYDSAKRSNPDIKTVIMSCGRAWPTTA